MSERGTHEPYVGYNDVLISSLSVNSNWKELDNCWVANFLREAERLEGQENFAVLKEKPIVDTINREGDEIGEYDYNDPPPSRRSVISSPYPLSSKIALKNIALIVITITTMIIR
ncbi:8325_t:CDS:2 [Diversispora eburnea]|uniref:8325_t:CDS:1 n=1 Tax=Diversispora eburnea TaxID=1213867 RepID=A0A9N9GJH1_9GLOM|nr:8325_t:CDS:2 [Diversispora eburnea]